MSGTARRHELIETREAVVGAVLSITSERHYLDHTPYGDPSGGASLEYAEERLDEAILAHAARLKEAGA